MSRAQHWPAAARNREPILAALQPYLPRTGRVIEIASGTGQHVAWFARHCPDLRFAPTDLDLAHLESIDAWVAETGLTNVEPARQLDTTAPTWAVGVADVIYCANMIHIAPWAAAEGLVAGVGRHLAADGVFCLYGPFRIAGGYSDSNAAFHASLQSRDPAWGVRDLEAIDALAEASGLTRVALHALPANNHLVVYRRAAA